MTVGDIRWSCGWTYASYILSILYLTTLVFICTFLYKIFKQQAWAMRQAQKVFLVLSLCACFGRMFYFFLWPPDTTTGDCSPLTNQPDTPLLDVLGSLPACLFLSAFSVNVFTFARIYHNLLDTNRWKFQAFSGVMGIANFVCYLTAVISLSLDSEALTYCFIFGVSLTSLIVAIGFISYAGLLYYKMEKKKKENRRKPGRPGAGPYVAGEFHNPMKRLVVVAAICLVCFFFRTIILPVLTVLENTDDWPILFVYFLSCELVPLALMLSIFDISPAPPSDSVPMQGRPQLQGIGWEQVSPTDGGNGDENEDYFYQSLPPTPVTPHLLPSGRAATSPPHRVSMQTAREQALGADYEVSSSDSPPGSSFQGDMEHAFGHIRQ